MRHQQAPDEVIAVCKNVNANEEGGPHLGDFVSHNMSISGGRRGNEKHHEVQDISDVKWHKGQMADCGTIFFFYTTSITIVLESPRRSTSAAHASVRT